MVRSRRGIEMLVNLVNISYCAMKLLPYMEFFLPGTKYLQLCRKNSTEKQPSCAVFFPRGSHISHDFTCPKDICQYTAASDITITHLFAGKDKVAVCRQISL